MARRKKTSVFEDLLDIASSINWKISLLIAVLTYFFFHYFAIQAMPIATDLQSATQSIPKQLFITFSKFLQYVVPVIFMIGACVSSIKSKRRVRLLDAHSGIESIRNMSWQDFELLVGEAFRRKGFEVNENGGGGADGGIDLVLTKNGKKSIVQCKRWKTFSIGVPLIRELYGVMTAERANDCIFVSSGNYTAEARLFAEDKPIWLIDGSELLEMVAGVQVQPQIKKPNSYQQPITKSLDCPLCGSAMIKRTAKKGANAGNEFWGCSAYPSCRGTR